ncbi:MAG TPA: hypothetical protein VHW01_22405 [Polyangiaceae bacterium]|jgi:hypothetical protein|nr:hypothetical protein [Polyangiaceae bacterium]
MPLELALRPRIRLRDDFAAPPRRSRLRLPKLALPVLGYWLVIGGITYALVHGHDSPDAALADEPVAAAEPQADAPALALPSEPEPAPMITAASPLTTPEPEPEPEPAAVAPPPTADGGREPVSLADAPRAARAIAPREQRAAERATSSRTQSTLSANDIAPLSSPFPELEPPSAAPPPSRERETARSSGSLPSCEAAAAAAVQDLDFASSDRTADLPSSAIAGVLENGVWLSSCGVPASTSLDVCVAIKGGRVTAATVISHPPDAGLNACVRQRAAALQFPYSSRVDIARTRF